MSSCDGAVYPITIVAVIGAAAVYVYWRPHVDEIVKLLLELVFALIVWNHIYVAWIAPELYDRWPDWYRSLSSGWEWMVSLAFALPTLGVIDALGKYTAMLVGTGIVLVVTKHMYLGASLGLAFGTGVVLHFALRSQRVKSIGSIVVTSMLCSVAVVYLSASLAVRGGTTPVHRLANHGVANQTVAASSLLRGANCTLHTVNMLVVCDSNCPVISDLPEQPGIASTTAAVAVSIAVVRIFGILFWAGAAKQKKTEEDEHKDEADKDQEDRALCFRCRRCCPRCSSWQRCKRTAAATASVGDAYRKQQQPGHKYNVLQFDGVVER